MPVIRKAFLSPCFDQSYEHIAFTLSHPDTNLWKEKMEHRSTMEAGEWVRKRKKKIPKVLNSEP